MTHIDVVESCSDQYLVVGGPAWSCDNETARFTRTLFASTVYDNNAFICTCKGSVVYTSTTRDVFAQQ